MFACGAVGTKRQKHVYAYHHRAALGGVIRLELELAEGEHRLQQVPQQRDRVVLDAEGLQVRHE